MRQAILGGAAVAAFVVTSYSVWSFTRPGPLVGMRTPIRHDDFLFSVNGTRTSPAPNNEHHLLVDVLVVNQAKRVDYEWRDTIAFIEDADGKRYDPVSHNTFSLQPGESRTATVSFLVPRMIREPVVRFWDGIYMGDAFNGGAYARTRVSI